MLENSSENKKKKQKTKSSKNQNKTEKKTHNKNRKKSVFTKTSANLFFFRKIEFKVAKMVINGAAIASKKFHFISLNIELSYTSAVAVYNSAACFTFFV